MNMRQVKSNAAAIMQYLANSDSKSCTFKELENALGLSSRSLNQALGWLVHDNQIQMDERGERISLTVCPFF